MQDTLQNLEIDGVDYKDTVDSAFDDKETIDTVMLTHAVNEGVTTDPHQTDGSTEETGMMGSGSKKVKKITRKVFTAAVEMNVVGDSPTTPADYTTTIPLIPRSKASVTEEEARRFGRASESMTAQTEQLMASEGEESKRFAIKSVVNPADGTEISLQQAIVLGVILPDEGVYFNSSTGNKKPIPTAMSEGLIKVCIHTSLRSLSPGYL